MITDLYRLKKEYSHIFTIEIYRIKRIIETGIYCILDFHQTDKPIDLLVKITGILKAHDCRTGIEIDNYLVLYRCGKLSEVMKEIRRKESIKPFHMACNDSRINKRFNKEAG